MMKIEYLYFIIPILYTCIHSIDLMSTYSRVAGFHINKNSIGYSIQNATAAYTRLFNMAMLPIIGYLIDKGIETYNFLLISIVSFFLSGLSLLIIFFNSKKIVYFFICKISKLVGVERKFGEFYYPSYPSFVINKKIFLMSIVIYTIHSIGVLVTFMLATVFSENKVMITQTTGMINATATLLLTLKLDPLLSVKIENNDQYLEAHASVMLARVVSFFIFSPSILISIYMVVK
ncbi:DUF2837 family protein [Vibrio cholerae]|nr:MULTISPECIES: DUF2837 family protein [Vibrio]EGQ9853965.1 DUF2837 family protein [Vibrio cholerae]MBN7283912.1 DUF2837 family protein [Vibrio paracholerae]MDV2383377.1 DUF2837 family protein [Vibrio cholerae]